MKMKLQKMIDSSETKWMYYISALQVSFIFMGISIFYIGKISEYAMQVGLYLAVTVGILSGITIANIENRDITFRVLLISLLNSMLVFSHIVEYMGIEAYTQEYLVLLVICLGINFMLLCLMTVLSAIVYAALFKKD